MVAGWTAAGLLGRHKGRSVAQPFTEKTCRCQSAGHKGNSPQRLIRTSSACLPVCVQEHPIPRAGHKRRMPWQTVPCTSSCGTLPPQTHCPPVKKHESYAPTCAPMCSPVQQTKSGGKTPFFRWMRAMAAFHAEHKLLESGPAEAKEASTNQQLLTTKSPPQNANCCQSTACHPQQKRFC